ncbi:MAG: hypothetical protein KDB27_35820, partial [Planctomycetales bacterium]|nr:hypothetical protein [Planctomycetales bacterium]
RRIDSAEGKQQFLRWWYEQAIFSGLSENQILELVRRRNCFDAEQAAKMLETLSVAEQPNYRNRLASLQDVNVLFVGGDRDQKYAAIAQSMARLSSSISCDIIENCGHAIPFEQPIRLAERIGRFLGIPLKGN